MSESFEKLEVTGFLEDFLRCATVPFPDPESTDWNEMLLDMRYSLKVSAPFLYERFQKDELCGDTLQAILNGRDGSRSGMPSQVEKRLQGIASAMVKTRTSPPDCCSKGN
ncbi:unnamed protein product [Cylindrotheca closterium]|uniref:Uncharacterized protein n=1 Tax=Cylindrotheca closterium TaxID=2856 RepID=A0AAD2PUA5_9STRA|nr:unnamed protein product [Cylindrotheca closterium]